ncbi:MAG: hypothetical protein WB974_07405, partial [Acidobacteriaceae bacterium]
MKGLSYPARPKQFPRRGCPKARLTRLSIEERRPEPILMGHSIAGFALTVDLDLAQQTEVAQHL